MSRSLRFLLLAIVLLLGTVSASHAQYGSGAAHLPYESQAATVGQTIGLTDVLVSYHRPGVKGRVIWGGLVPFNGGKPIPWRGGANENTTIAFSTDVMIDGKPLAAGTYGLHFIPSADDWIVIFSKNATSWGSFSYRESEDALRVHAKPAAAPFTEYLTYEFPEVTPNSALLQLHWEKLAVGVTISIDLTSTVLANLKRELRNSVGFSWVGYNTAAEFCAEQKVELQQGLEWAQRSVSAEERFENLETEASILRLMGKTASADSTMGLAMAKATPVQLHSYARGLIADGKKKEAMAIFEMNAKNHPDLWFVYAGLARGYEGLGDLPNAVAQMKIALSKAPEGSKNGAAAAIQQWEGMLQKK
jgi:hypothetical protein